jgi:hypothetical protein
MLEVGGSYKIRMWEDTDDGGMITAYHHCKLIDKSDTLIKIQQSSQKPLIINTASVAFVSAESED